MHCPLCLDTDLDAVIRSGIEIDRCPRCKGIWLDRGELDKLLDEGPRPRSGDRLDHADERAYPKHKPKSAKSKKSKKKKSKGQKLADLLDDVLDL